MVDLLEIGLWYSAVMLCFVLMVMFLMQYSKKESLSRPFFLGLAIFMLLYGIARLIENTRRYSVGSYNDILYAWIIGTQITEENFIMRFLYYFIAWIGIAIMYFNIERFIFKKNKYLLTICSIAEGALSISIYFYFNIFIFWIMIFNFFIVAYFIPLLFINLARKTPSGAIRNGCVLIALGMALFVTGVMFDLPETSYFLFLLNQEIPEALIRFISPIMLTSGLVFFSLGFRSFFKKE
jgi:hypothetical protein